VSDELEPSQFAKTDAEALARHIYFGILQVAVQSSMFYAC
jgi:hypothetical protein